MKKVQAVAHGGGVEKIKFPSWQGRYYTMSILDSRKDILDGRKNILYSKKIYPRFRKIYPLTEEPPLVRPPSSVYPTPHWPTGVNWPNIFHQSLTYLLHSFSIINCWERHWKFYNPYYLHKCKISTRQQDDSTVNSPTMKGKEGREWVQLMGLSQHAMPAWWVDHKLAYYTKAAQSPPTNTQYENKSYEESPKDISQRNTYPSAEPRSLSFN